jgi:putative FmdB family regulatory protein
MPLYVYFCPVCGDEREMIHSINSDPHIVCGKCGKDMKRKMCGGGLLRFNGPGFYETDYKRKEVE